MKTTSTKPAPPTASEVKIQLRELVLQVESYIKHMDFEMRINSTRERGERIAKLLNELEMAKDVAARYGLGRKFKGEKS